MDKKKNTHGGKRAGAGRKNEGKIQVSPRLAPDVVLILRNGKIPQAQMIEIAVREKYGK